jgi:acetolactate synthase-1/2/3 large subunit
MTTVTGGELVVRTLQKAGVKKIFGLHGAHIDTIFQSCMDHSLPIIDTRHEAAAGHAAEGYARISRKLGVALVTAGGGFTNVVTSIANAYLDRTPVLFLTGSGALRDDETNTLQAGIDQVAIATPVTKWAHRVIATNQIPRLVAQAIRIAMSAPRGPVLLDIPWDILTNQLNEADASIPEVYLPALGVAPRPNQITEAIKVLMAAERAVIVVGSEASRSDSGAAIKTLAMASGLPVFGDYEGLNLTADLPDTNRGGLVQGLYGLAKSGVAPDAVLLLGIRFGLNTVHGSGQLLPLDAKIIQVDPDARELGRLQTIAQGIVADVGDATAAFAEAASGCQWPNRAGWRQIVRDHIGARRRNIASMARRGEAFHHYVASDIVARHVDKNTVVVADGALTYLWLSEVISETRPGGFLCHGYLGSMGVGFGTAIGAQVAAADMGKRVILVTGDGAVGYSLGEFDTAVRHNIPLIVIVMNNQSWGATLHFQKLAVGPTRITNTRLQNGSYHDVAAALGADSYFASDAESLEQALSQALAKDRPACINVRVDLEAIPPEEMILIGMDPFGEATT